MSVEPQWAQNGITIAGGHGAGEAKHQLNRPFGLDINENQTVFIADSLNFRAIGWTSGATSGNVVATGAGNGTNIYHLRRPTDVVCGKYGDTHVIYWSVYCFSRCLLWIGFGQGHIFVCHG